MAQIKIFLFVIIIKLSSALLELKQKKPMTSIIGFIINIAICKLTTSSSHSRSRRLFLYHAVYQVRTQYLEQNPFRQELF